MTSNRLPVILVILAIVLIGLYSSVYVVNAREQAIVVRFGEIQSVKTEPGIYFKLPFSFMDADRVQLVEKQKLRLDLDNIQVQVKGGATFDVDAFVIYSINDARRFRETVSGDRDAAEARLRTRLDSALRRVYGLREFDAALSDERVSMMLEVRDDLRPDAELLGLNIQDVRIRRTDLTADVAPNTYNRMRSERLAEAELLRAQGTEDGLRRRAVADRQVVEITADAQRDAEILRGQGDAERNRVFADAFSRNPAFFEFYRSMAAYSSALSSQDTTLVLSPNSEFFRYFDNAAGALQPPANAAAPAPAVPGATAPAAPAQPAN
ncbi:protein HflC [Rhizobium phaseoli]|uniref:Protein HflC n=2 Tax=Rhizobium TaxID=379 RepID=A0A192TAX6_9HYPH|nr:MULTISPECIES: protease modulator HflC [Rhizobium]ACE91888.1 hydrolase serine protease transmembrane subunit C protein [Rhizobium etli CIAT 652]EGE57032.1 hydrolase serine protease transmembrane subunit C protein [Rhizobium etli CNPAF512]KEC73760.1 hydrolase serine protease transmembrane subunit C protein [Rhizobium leguminosarum bv. phaseoli CCGM1]MDH6646915.1 membrane protease subunit HflC [Rhizobium esperanzae]ANL28756.1 protein HflC [Rhizobium phaseoli]